MITYINESNQICTEEEFLLEKAKEDKAKDKAASKEAKLAAKLEKQKAKETKKTRVAMVKEIKDALKSYATDIALEYKSMSKKEKADLPKDEHNMYVCMKDINFMARNKRQFINGESNDIYYNIGSKVQGASIALAITVTPIAAAGVAAGSPAKNAKELEKHKEDVIKYIKKETGYDCSMTIKSNPAMVKITVNNA